MKVYRKILFVCLLAAVMAVVIPFTANASAIIDYSMSGTISITMLTPDLNEPIPGMGFEMFRVGDIDQTEPSLTYVPGGEFVAAGVSFSDISTASGSRLVAEQLADYADSNDIAGAMYITDTNGRVQVESLTLGLFLVVPNDFDSVSPYENMSPFLVSVPITSIDGASWEYVVSIFPKLETKPTEPTTQPTTAEPTTKPEELPQTGVLRWPIPLLAVSGVLLFSIGWAGIYIKRKKHD